MSAPSSVFLSYRRSDTRDVAGRVFDELSRDLGRQRIFKDVDSIPIATNFRDVILEQIRSSIVLVLIGPGWIMESGLGHRNRLWDPEDFVRLEIEAALQFQSPIVPIFVNDAEMPSKESLPQSIHPLSGKQGFAIRADPDFHPDVARLTSLLRGLLQKVDTGRRAPPELLDDIFLNCQAWYNDIVKTVADIVAVIRNQKIDDADRHAAVDGIQLVYQNSRTYVPKVLSYRRVLSKFDDTESVVEALDDFLSHIYVQPNDRINSPYCRAPLDFIRSPLRWLAPKEKGTGAVVEEETLEASVARDYMYMSLGRISHSLQRLSDAVSETKLHL